MGESINKKKAEFISINYTAEQIQTCLNLLDNQKKQIIELRYGLNGNNITDVQTIANMFNITMACVYKICSKFEQRISLLKTYGNIDVKLLEKNNTFFKEFLSYKREEVLESLNLLKEESREVIELYYGLNNNSILSVKEIAERFNKNDDWVYRKIVVGKKNIRRLLQGERRLERDIDIFRYFSQYDSLKVLQAIESLGPLNKKIIELRYGLNKEDKKSIKEIADYLGVNENTIHQRIKYSKKLMQQFLEPCIFEKNPAISKLLSDFNQYPKEKVLEAIKCLDTTKTTVMELRYGLNGNEEVEIEEIAKILCISKNNVYKIISRAKKDLSIILKDPKSLNKLHPFYQCFPEYSLEEVNFVLSLMKQKYKKVLEMRYGLNGEKKVSISLIAGQNRISNDRVSVIVNYTKKQISQRLEEIYGNRKKFTDNFPGSSPTLIAKAFRTIDLRERRILELFYGFNGQPVMDINDIAKLFLITDKEVAKIIIHSKKRMSKLLNQLNNKYDKDIFNEPVNLIENNYEMQNTNEEVKYLIEKLNDPIEKTVLLLKLGFIRRCYTVPEIAKILFMTENQIFSILNSAMENLKKVTIIPDKNINTVDKQLKLVK